MANIKFGTDGWRAVVGKDFNDENVTLVTNAIAKYVFDNFGLVKKIIIGHDFRNKADYYAEFIGEIFADYGFDTYLSTSALPTPVLAYAAKDLNASAIMVTASHNPGDYLGIKYIPDYAGPATGEITDAIVANIDKNFTYSTIHKQLNRMDFFDKYYKHISTLINFKKIKDLNKNIIFDALYSAATNYFDKILKLENIKFEVLHNYRDINFGGGLPEPKPNYLTELIAKIKNSHDTIGLSNDGDADRYGVINENGEYVTPNEVMGMLLVHLVQNKKMTGKYVKTVAGSRMHDVLAKKLGLDIIETPVGFKHVGEAMRKNDVILGGEESGGLSIKGHIPEKDGLLANFLILEMLAYENKTLVELQKEFNNFLDDKFINTRIDITLENQVKTKEIINEFKQNINIHKTLNVKNVSTKDGVKLYLNDNKSRILIRPSGTEPLLRVYIETSSQENLEDISNTLKSLIN